MKKLLSFLPKKAAAALLSLALLVGVSAPALATFGPSRPTFTMASPASYVTFNSITDNPVAGDERYFLNGAKPGDSGYTDTVQNVVDGQEVTLRMYVHNNAASNLNLVANNTQVRVALPTGSNQSPTVTGYISADNANPGTVYDTAQIVGTNNGFMELEYVNGSASFQNNVGTFTLADSIVTTGAQVGYGAMNGALPGCSEYSGWVTLRVKVNMPRLTIQKLGRLAGEGSDKWRESVNAKIGDTVEWLIEVRNPGSTNLDNIIVVDELPPYMTAEAGSVKLINSNHPASDPFIYDANAIQQANGKIYVNVNAGSYSPNSSGYVMFSSKIVSNPAIACGNQRLTNKSYATPQGYGAVSSYAYVIVFNNNACATPHNLPNTGPGQTIALFIGATAVGIVGYRLWMIRRLSK